MNDKQIREFADNIAVELINNYRSVWGENKEWDWLCNDGDPANMIESKLKKLFSGQVK